MRPKAAQKSSYRGLVSDFWQAVSCGSPWHIKKNSGPLFLVVNFPCFMRISLRSDAESAAFLAGNSAPAKAIATPRKYFRRKTCHGIGDGSGAVLFGVR